MKPIFLIAAIISIVAFAFNGCASSGGAVVTTVCNTVDQICTYKGLLCSVQSSTANTKVASSSVSLESFYRSKLVELAESLKVQAQPVIK